MLNQNLWDFLCRNQNIFKENDISVSLIITLDHPSMGAWCNNISISFTDKDNNIRKDKWEIINRLFS